MECLNRSAPLFCLLFLFVRFHGKARAQPVCRVISWTIEEAGQKRKLFDLFVASSLLASLSDVISPAFRSDEV